MLILHTIMNDIWLLKELILISIMTLRQYRGNKDAFPHQALPVIYYYSIIVRSAIVGRLNLSFPSVFTQTVFDIELYVKP